MRVYQIIAVSVLLVSTLMPSVAANATVEKIKCPDGKKRVSSSVNTEAPHKQTVQCCSSDNKCEDLNLSCREEQQIKVQFESNDIDGTKTCSPKDGGNKDGGNKDGGNKDGGNKDGGNKGGGSSSSPSSGSGASSSPTPSNGLNSGAEMTRLNAGALAGAAIIAYFGL
jgi:hypothetical protein